MIYFLTFGAGKQCYIDAASQLCEQANLTGLFGAIFNICEQDLRNDEAFWLTHGNFIENNPRGFGYWIWKPFIIKKVLSMINEGDTLIYADAGCEFDMRFTHLIPRLDTLLVRKKILGTLTASNDITHTKASVSKLLGLSGIPTLRLGHIQAGLIFMRKCEEITNFIQKWYDKCSLAPCMIDDSPSTIGNYEGFREHRHDQSIFNILLKLEGLYNHSMPIGSMPIIPAQNCNQAKH